MKIKIEKNIFFLLKKNFLFLKDNYFGFIKIPKNIILNLKDNILCFNIIDNNINKEKVLLKIIKNLFLGIKMKWKKILEFSGLGFKILTEYGYLILNLGYSIPIKIKIPNFIDINIIKNKIFLFSVYKDKLGLFCNKILKIKKYNPYKKKGIFLLNKFFIKKSNKKKQ